MNSAHLHTLPSGAEDVKTIGLYSSKEEAMSAVQRLSKESGFRDHPKVIDPLVDNGGDGFYIDEYEFNEDQWRESFATL